MLTASYNRDVTTNIDTASCKYNFPLISHFG